MNLVSLKFNLNETTSMDLRSLIILCSCALFVMGSTSATLDTIPANQAIKDGETIISYDQTYELGFFSPGKSKNRYLGIWYYKISKGTVVWVANRETPITDKSGMFKLSIDGNLQILSGMYNSTVIWSSNSTVSTRNNNTMIVVQLLDTGNLVMWNRNSRKQHVIWQSFDYPGNTILPGMKFGKNLVTGRESSLKPWKSPDDPSPGPYSHWLDTNGYPQIIVRRGSVIQFRGPWNGLKFQGVLLGNQDPMYSLEFVYTEDEIYYRFERKTSVFQRILVMPDDTTVMLNWIDQIQDWALYGFSKEKDNCGRYGLCGAYGSCNINRYPLCKCLAGFRPRVPGEWDKANGSSGCVRKRALDCGSGDGFRKISGVIFPDTRRSLYNHSMNLKECEMACRSDCNCTAYANSDVRKGGSGCLLWFGELMDITEDDEDQDLYIKFAASELADSERSINKTKSVVIVIISTSSAVVLLFAVVYACIKKKIRPHMKERGSRYGLNKMSNNVEMEDLYEIPFFNLHEIAKATNDFSINNKIGEGGFGPVYKGVLEDGQEIGVKRLSQTSQQGLDEFMNEIRTIAKLQHRNLVKLLGYCIHENELILIYEYMTNKSLDLILFDETESMMLDWPQRFNIIHGMARGILYLHQDSRLQIIHRDLKAGNILLDANMNPKISDFGLARKFVGFDITTKTKKIVGTYGYIPPEYALYGRFSIKSDVFSFGVLVLEIVSGKRNREFFYDGHNDNLLGHAWRLYRQGRSIELMSESLRGSSIDSEVLRSIQVGLLCVQHHAEDRPTMLSVVLMLVSEGVLPQPKQPAFCSEESRLELDSVSSGDEYMITLLYAR